MNWQAVLRRFIGALLVLLVTVPVYLIIVDSGLGRSGQDIIRDAGRARELMLLGSMIVLGLGIIASRLISPERFESWTSFVARIIEKPGTVRFAFILALASALITLAFSQLILHGKPNLIDGMAQLLHARFLAAGWLAAPDVSLMDHWMIQNSVLTPHGWVSQYPPGFPLLLAAGMSIGMLWIIPPLLVAVTVFFTTLTAHRLLPERAAVARLGSVLVVLSPFMIGLAGSYMNHIAASAFISLAVYASTRTELYWSMLAGFGVAATFCTRPLAGIVAAVLVVIVWWVYRREDGVVTGSLFALLGGSFVIGLLSKYNSYLFGSPFRFGYTLSDGETTSLGFHKDPWGHWYGIQEAIAYTSSDLTTLSQYLIESVIPAVAVCGLFLFFARKLSKGEFIITAWALAGSIALFFYWHHGIFMGPRMLADFAPAWALLVAVSAVGLVRAIPQHISFKGYSPRVGVGVALAISFATGILYLAPERLIRYGGGYMASSRIEIPKIDHPAIVFVHGGWSGRIAARLLANGMRRDSVETALRQNPTCAVQHYLTDSTVKLDLHPKSYEIPSVEFTPGNGVRIKRGEVLTPECSRELMSDRFGIVDIPPMLWQGALPGIPGDPKDGVIVLRDLGPDANKKALIRYPNRIPMFFFRPSPNEIPVLRPYTRVVAGLWGS